MSEIDSLKEEIRLLKERVDFLDQKISFLQNQSTPSVQPYLTPDWTKKSYTTC